MVDNLINSKCYINLEIRPRGARVGLDCFYCRTPAILCESTLYSDLLPEFSYPMTLDFNLVSFCAIASALALALASAFACSFALMAVSA